MQEGLPNVDSTLPYDILCISRRSIDHIFKCCSDHCQKKVSIFNLLLLLVTEAVKPTFLFDIVPLSSDTISRRAAEKIFRSRVYLVRLANPGGGGYITC